MKHVLHWIKGAWLWLFSDVRQEIRDIKVRPPGERGEDE